MWKDAWIPQLLGHRLSGEGRIGLNYNLCVEDIIDWEKGQWDLVGIQAILTLEE